MKIKIHKDYLAWLNKSGQFHREDGAAVERADGAKHWYINNKLHREDGSAVEWADGTKSWYVNGKRLTENEFNRRNDED